MSVPRRLAWVLVFLAVSAVLDAQTTRKIPAPDAAAQRQGQKAVDEVYKSDVDAAKTPELKIALAKTLLQAAIETRDDPASRFVLLGQAQDLAARAGDLELAVRAADETGADYDVDAWKMKTEAAAAAARSSRRPDEDKALAPQVAALADKAVADDQYEAAQQLGELALNLAKASGDAALLRQALDCKQDVAVVEAAYGQARTALATLAAGPADPEANLIAGKFLCFMKGQWSRGLAMLAAGNDAELKALAETELAGPAAAPAQATLGDAWWDLAQSQKGPARTALRQHAAGWYRRAALGLEGLAKAKVDKRLKELDAAGESAAKAAPAGGAIDLLKLVDIPRDTIRGTWQRVDDGIQSDARRDTMLRIPYRPPEEFDLHVQLTRVSGIDGPDVFFPNYSFGVGCYSNVIAGFEKIGGRSLKNNVSTVRSAAFLHTGQRQDLVIQVRSNGVAAYLDGKLLTKYQTDFSDMTGGVGAKGMAVDSYETVITFHVIEIIEITGHGQVLAGEGIDSRETSSPPRGSRAARP